MSPSSARPAGEREPLGATTEPPAPHLVWTRLARPSLSSPFGFAQVLDSTSGSRCKREHACGLRGHVNGR
eukprot:7710862-Alexandrium_andersonii.AAC.1